MHSPNSVRLDLLRYIRPHTPPPPCSSSCGPNTTTAAYVLYTSCAGSTPCIRMVRLLLPQVRLLLPQVQCHAPCDHVVGSKLTTDTHLNTCIRKLALHMATWSKCCKTHSGIPPFSHAIMPGSRPSLHVPWSSKAFFGCLPISHRRLLHRR